MTAHKIRDHNDPITTSSSMMLDRSVPDTSPEDDAGARRAPRLVSAPSCDDELMIDESASPAGVGVSITGKIDNIEGKYRIDPRILGTGRNGSVRECVDRATGKRFAVKSVRKGDDTVTPGGIAREIVLLREMRHRNIVRLVDVYEDVEYVHLVTHLCAGGELFDRIVEESSNGDNGAACFSEEEAAKIMHQILTAVSYMHQRGVAHRDIKPENILFETADHDSPVKIIDFGLSRKHHGGLELPMSTVVGTPYYVAPEVLRRRYGKSCDLWSAGVIAYILLCGYPPFNGANNDRVHRSVLRGRCRFPAEEWDDVGAEAVDFVRMMLQTDPTKRMTAEQALNHPWMVKHVSTDTVMDEEESRDNSSVEVVYDETPRKYTVHCGYSPTRSPARKLRMSTFGL